MKKIFSVLITFILFGTTSLSMIGCSNKEQLTINNFYVIGDSLSDTGSGALAKTQYLQNDESNKIKQILVSEPFYCNSWSNGPVAAQVVANKFNLTLSPGWNFTLNQQNFNHIGNNYAVFGEIADNSINQLQETFNINHQVAMLLNQHKLVSNDAVLFEIGSNDIASILTKNEAQVKIKINNVINNEKQGLETLINHGARNIVATDVPDLTLTPKIKKLLQNNAIKLANAQTICLNFQKKWEIMINNLNKKYINIIHPYKLSYYLPHYMEQFALDKKGIIDQSAAKTELKELPNTIIYRPKYNPLVTKATEKNYFYFDEFHPSQWFHNLMGNDIYNLIKNNILLT